MSPLVEYNKISEARTQFKHVLDVAADGTPVTMRRDGKRFAVVDAARLRCFLASIGPGAEVIHEDDSWSLFFPGLPLAAEGDTLDDAIDDAIVVLREYATDWVDHLRAAPNHADNWGLVQLISLSSDEELRAWLNGFAS